MAPHPTGRRSEMKYRIVQYKNGRFGIQHKRIFIWWDETFTTNEDMTFLETFESVEKAEDYLAEKFCDKFAIMRVVKVWK
jgi:hypothetical protein